MTESKYMIVGVSTNEAGTKVRFTTSEVRVKAMAATGHSNIMMIELPEPMQKMDAVKFISDLPEFANGPAQAAIAHFIKANTKPEPKKRGRPRKVAVEEAAPVQDVQDAPVVVLGDHTASSSTMNVASSTTIDELEDEPF